MMPKFKGPFIELPFVQEGEFAYCVCLPGLVAEYGYETEVSQMLLDMYKGLIPWAELPYSGEVYWIRVLKYPS